MKKGRKIKFTLGMKIASILCCVALVSVGFAAWWIVEFPVAQKTEDGNFTVYSVESKKIIISEPEFLESDNADIIFGAPTAEEERNLSPNYHWLGHTGIDVEDLTATLQFSVSIEDDNTSILNTFIDNIYVEFNAGSKFNTLVANNQLAAPVVKYNVSETKDTTVDWSSATSGGAYSDTDGLTIDISKNTELDHNTVWVQVRFEFGWASGENPYLTYNKLPYSVDNANAASKLLGDVDTALKATGEPATKPTYVVTISTNPAGSETTAAPAN